MHSQTRNISDQLFQIKVLKDRLHKFETGEKYIRMQDEHKKALACEIRRCQRLEKELADAHAAIVDVRNKWFQTCEDVIKEKEKELKKKDTELRRMEEMLLDAQRQRDEALQKLHDKSIELYEVKTQLEAALGQILELTARVNRDYTNSSKSSSMSPDHGKIQNSRESSGRRPGGQPGHEHHPRKRQEPTDTIEIPAPDKYEKDPFFKRTGRLIRKQLVRLHVSTEVIEYVTPEFRNQLTGQRVHADFPAGLTDDVTYDGTVKAAAYLLNNECYVSVDKTRVFLKEISGGKIDLSEGMICKLSKTFSRKTEEERSQIFLELLASPVVHADFTFGRMAGKQASVMITCTPDLALYQAREKKGHEGVKGSPVELYRGTLVSDHEAALICHGTRHQECMAHMERYIKSSIENEPGLEWNKRMLEWIRNAIHYWKLLAGGEVYDEDKVSRMLSEYDEIIEKAKEEYEYEPPGDYYKDGYNTYQRMSEDKEEYVLFLRDPSVPPTNNLAERNGRQFKRKAHQVMAFRSREGVGYFCDGLTIIQTLKSRGKNLYEAVTARFNQGMEA